MENRIRFKIGEIEFEAQGESEVVERERDAFMKMVLPAAIDAVVKTKGRNDNVSYNQLNSAEERALLVEPIETQTVELIETNSRDDSFERTNLASFLKNKGVLTEQEFTLFAAYFDEKKNGKKFFTKEDVDRYYSEARRKKPQNISDSLTKLAQKGLIMDADSVEQKNPKPYIISTEGLTFIEEFVPKNTSEKAHTKTCKNVAKVKSNYSDIDADKLHLEKYPEIKSLKDFKNKMMLVLYIVSNEGLGEWFSTLDVMFLLTDIFGEAATKDQVNGVFNREKLWFKVEAVEGSKRDTRRKLLNKGIEYAEELIKSFEQ